MRAALNLKSEILKELIYKNKLFCPSRKINLPTRAELSCLDKEPLISHNFPTILLVSSSSG